MAEASVGELRTRVAIHPGSDASEPLTMLAHGLNILLADLESREKRAALQSDRLRTLLAELPLGVVIAEAPAGRILYRNRAAAELVGRGLGDRDVPAYGQDGRVTSPGGAPFGGEEWPLARAMLRREIVRNETLQRLDPGEPARWIAASAAPVLDEEGRVTGGILLVEDITQKREEDAFRDSLLAGVSDAGIGLVVTDGRHVLAVNDAYCAMLRATREELVGLDTTLLVVPEERAEGRARQDTRLSERRPQSFRCTTLRRDGTTFPTEVIGKPLPGDPPRFLGLVRDITEEERARAEVEAARRTVAQSEKLSALGSLVSGVAHEIRTPLTYLQTNLHLLQRRVERAVEAGSVDALREVLPEIPRTIEAADRLERLVEDLRRFTRLRASAPVLAPLHESVAQAVELFEVTHRGKASLRAKLDATPEVVVDSFGLQQVVLNLLANAAEASAPGGPIHVRTTATPDGALLEVEDEGAGIDAGTLQRAFDPFFTTKTQGTGLGLSIVRRIVDEAGGTIDVDSAPGRGTTFRIRIPRSASPSSGGTREREGI